MSFTSMSKMNDILCQLTNMSLVMKRDFYPVMSLRDKFVGLLRPNHKITEIILDNISLQVNPGDRIGIIGLNGAGKTTLCKTIAGMYQPTSGDLWVTKNIRAIFNSGSALYPTLSGRENIELLISLFYPTEIGNKKLIESVIEFSELGHYIDAPFISYSNGMKSRLFLSVALQRTADLLIFDESFEGADHLFAKKAMAQVKTLTTSQSACIVVTHSLESLRTLCNKVLILNQGGLFYEGELENGITEFYKISRTKS